MKSAKGGWETNQKVQSGTPYQATIHRVFSPFSCHPQLINNYYWPRCLLFILYCGCRSKTAKEREEREEWVLCWWLSSRPCRHGNPFLHPLLLSSSFPSPPPPPPPFFSFTHALPPRPIPIPLFLSSPLQPYNKTSIPLFGSCFLNLNSLLRRFYLQGSLPLTPLPLFYTLSRAFFFFFNSLSPPLFLYIYARC